MPSPTPQETLAREIRTLASDQAWDVRVDYVWNRDAAFRTGGVDEYVYQFHEPTSPVFASINISVNGITEKIIRDIATVILKDAREALRTTTHADQAHHHLHMTTPTPEERRLKSLVQTAYPTDEQLRDMQLRLAAAVSASYGTALGDLFFLIDAFNRREQEHQREIKEMTVASKQAYDTLKDIIIKGDARHAEEIRKAEGRGVGIAIEAMRDAFKTPSAMQLLSDPNAQRDFIVTTRTFAEDYLRAESRAPSTPPNPAS